jgi:squalene-hopene/tetraprenyl-beta-curcumene cyclase
MTRRAVLAALLLPPAVLLAGPARAGEKGPAAQQVRGSVGRGLAFLQKEGLAWMHERKCVSCHHMPFMLWSHNEARRRGLAPDAGKLDDWNGQVLNLYLANRKEYEAKKNAYVEATSLLLGQVVPAAKDPKADTSATLAHFVAIGQQADGSWKYAGQVQKRPDREANETTTGWAVLALTSVEKSDPAYPKARDRALAWLKTNHTGEGNEAVVLRLLLELRFGEPARARSLAKELQGRQNADDGWSWAKGLSSDPFATGQSLYALGKAGLTPDDPAVRKACEYLLRTQRPDGSWFALTKKAKGDNVISTYWGTAWATIGLVRTLPEGPPPAAKITRKQIEKQPAVTR